LLAGQWEKVVSLMFPRFGWVWTQLPDPTLWLEYAGGHLDFGVSEKLIHNRHPTYESS
tara:strand:+ start:7811 stop:7984 length:174 start_codon:yes stop_codon:yes gene_type:complete